MTPRIPPGKREDVGPVNWAIVRVLGAATGGPPPNVFTTLARHRGLFRRWLRFAGALMPGGTLNRQDSELVILRVAHNCDCEYERDQHVRIARSSGVAEADIERVPEGPDAPGWTQRQRRLLRATDALHADRDIGDELWAELEDEFSERQRIELCLLIGHYEMLAMTLNALRVESDAGSGEMPALLRHAQRLLRR